MGGAAGEIENKAISASNLKLKLKLTEAELGNILITWQSCVKVQVQVLASVNLLRHNT